MIGKYLLTVIAATLLIALCKTLLPSKSIIGSLLKLICGVVLLSVIITPIKNTNIRNSGILYSDIKNDAAYIIEENALMVKKELSENIKNKLQSYIFDKGASLDLHLQVSVTMNDEEIPAPESIQLTGRASPYAKSELMKIIKQDIGIAEENIQWNS